MYLHLAPIYYNNCLLLVSLCARADIAHNTPGHGINIICTGVYGLFVRHGVEGVRFLELCMDGRTDGRLHAHIFLYLNAHWYRSWCDVDGVGLGLLVYICYVCLWARIWGFHASAMCATTQHKITEHNAQVHVPTSVLVPATKSVEYWRRRMTRWRKREKVCSFPRTFISRNGLTLVVEYYEPTYKNGKPPPMLPQSLTHDRLVNTCTNTHTQTTKLTTQQCHANRAQNAKRRHRWPHAHHYKSQTNSHHPHVCAPRNSPKHQ